MSAEAVGWTYRYSAMTGSAFSVHLAIADTVNDMHGNEVWLAQDTLASKSRCDRKTVRAALLKLIEAGYLTELEGVPSGSGRPIRRFRFERPADAPVVYEPAFTARSANGEPRPIGRSNGATDPVSMGNHAPLNGEPRPINPIEPKEGSQISLDVRDTKEDPEKLRGKGSDYRFDDAWNLYPPRRGRKVGKEKAREQWKKLGYEEKGRCFKAIRTFAAEQPEFPPDMFRWVRDRTWQDYLEPATAAAPAVGGRPGPARKRFDEMTEEEFAVARRSLSASELTEALDARRRAAVLRGEA